MIVNDETELLKGNESYLLIWHQLPESKIAFEDFMKEGRDPFVSLRICWKHESSHRN